MKRFKDLEIVGQDGELLAIIETISANLPSDWLRDTGAEERLAGISSEGKEAGFAFSREAKNDQPPCGLFLARKSGRFYVSNIVPRESGELTIDQYNSILDEFADILLRHLGAVDAPKLNVTSDQATITDWVSPEAAGLLKRFSTLANQSTGSSHPLDFERWVAFLIQVHKENSPIEVDNLIRWLVEGGLLR